jgi:MFS family permease
MLVVGCCATFAMAMSDQPWVFIAGAIVASLTVGGIPGLMFLSLVRLHSRAPGVIGGIGLSAGSFGGIAGPVSFGLVAENLSIRSAWLLCSAWALTAAVLMHAAARKVVPAKTAELRSSSSRTARPTDANLH